MPYKKPVQKIIARTKSFDTNIRIALGVAAVVVLWMLSGLILPSEKHTEATPAIQNEAKQKSVAIEEIQAQPYTEMVGLTGIVKAGALVSIKAQTNGRVVEISKERGSVVTAGDVVLRLDTEDKKEALNAALAAQKEAQSLYNAAKKLNQQGYRADTSLEGSKAQLEEATRAVKMAQDNLNFTEIKAPFNGIADDRMVEIGDYLNTGDDAFTMIDNSLYLIEGFVAQKKRHLVKVGKIATFTTITGVKAEGVVDFVANAGDEITRTYRVLIRVDGAKYNLPINMSGRIEIPAETENAVLIPYSALVLNDRGNLGAMIVNEENIATFYEIDPLADSGEGYYIQNLPQTTRLVVKGQNSVSDGEKVTAEKELLKESN